MKIQGQILVIITLLGNYYTKPGREFFRFHVLPHPYPRLLLPNTGDSKESVPFNV